MTELLCTQAVNKEKVTGRSIMRVKDLVLGNQELFDA